MLEIITLLFDEYTKNLSASQAGPKPEHREARYEQLRELVGEDTALDIWDAAVAEGAVEQEVYFPGRVENRDDFSKGIAFPVREGELTPPCPGWG